MNLFDWVNGLAADTALTVKAVAVALVLVFIAYHAIMSKLTLAKIVVSAIVGGIFIALMSGGIDFVADMVGGTLS